MFRLGDAYLMYAELAARGAAGANTGTAVGYVNELRERAYGDDSGNIDAGDLTLDFVLAERAASCGGKGTAGRTSSGSVSSRRRACVVEGRHAGRQHDRGLP